MIIPIFQLTGVFVMMNLEWYAGESLVFGPSDSWSHMLYREIIGVNEFPQSANFEKFRGRRSFQCAVLLFFALAWLSGCATPPQAHTFSNTQTYNGNFNQVWSNLIRYLATNNIQLKTIDKSSGLIYTDTYDIPLPSDDMDCGTSIVQDVSASGSMNILVNSNSDGTTTATINAIFQVIRINPVNGDPLTINCSSTGNLEQQIFSQLGAPN